MDREWVLTSSTCWKHSTDGNTVHVLYGPTEAGSAQPSPVEVRAIKYFPGPLDLALVKTSRVRREDRTRFFPCLLSKDGARVAVRGRLHGVLLGRATYLKSYAKIKVKGFTFRLKKVESCSKDALCIPDEQERLPRDKYETEGAAFFVKVGRSKWALAGFTGEFSTNDGQQHTVSLLHPAMRWLDRTLH